MTFDENGKILTHNGSPVLNVLATLITGLVVLIAAYKILMALPMKVRPTYALITGWPQDLWTLLGLMLLSCALWSASTRFKSEGFLPDVQTSQQQFVTIAMTVIIVIWLLFTKI